MKIIPGVNVPLVGPMEEGGNPTADAMMLGALLNDLIEKAIACVPSTNSVSQVRQAAVDLKQAFVTLQDRDGGAA